MPQMDCVILGDIPQRTGAPGLLTLWGSPPCSPLRGALVIKVWSRSDLLGDLVWGQGCLLPSFSQSLVAPSPCLLATSCSQFETVLALGGV